MTANRRRMPVRPLRSVETHYDMSAEINDRAKRVLAALVREYIATGEPVASALLVTAPGLGVSSATVRAILARLEDEGYVQQPHTSAGRVPTDRGYRFYVDLLLEAKRSATTERTANAVEARLRRDSSAPLLDSVLPSVSHLLSQASRQVGLAELPDDRTMYVEAAASLLGEAHGLTLDMLRTLMQMIEEKQRLVRVLNEYIDGPGLTVVIGAEHLDPGLRPFSLVASTYEDGTGTGTIGVIGPTRMRYSRAIAVVDGAAQAVSRVLREN